MSHTPGPWDFGNEIHLISNGGIYDGQDMSEEVFDATVFAGTGEDWEQIATGITSEDNARLIAAAPDMLAMLEELREGALLSWWDGAGVPVGIVERLDEVIRKARGSE